MGRLPLLLFLLMWSTAGLRAEEQPKNPVPDQPASALPWLSLDKLSATRDRPLFAPDRRKPAPPPVVAVAPDPSQMVQRPPPPPPPAQYELTGIIVSSGETIVVLLDQTTSESIAVHPGESVGPWTVQLNPNDTVTLKDGEKEIKLEMYAEQQQ